MGIPVWVTQAGNLGTIEEGEFYELLMEAYDPGGGELEYEVIAGYMPPGLVMSERGVIQGRPKDLYLIRGVPFEVAQDVTSTFCCRITSSTTNQISDRTFSITVTGQDAPTLITESQELDRVFDGDFVDIGLVAIDLDNEPIRWSIIKGSLPPGLTLDENTGSISGYVDPSINTAQDVTVGWDSLAAGWEEYPWSHGTTWLSQDYQFTVEITDGKEFAQRTYSIFVYAKSLITADSDIITVDDDEYITGDMDTKHRPVLLTDPADLGIYQHDNYFAYQFVGKDFDFEEFEFGIISADGNGFDSILSSGFDSELFDQSGLSLPPGLTLNPTTGWLYGYLTTQVPAQIEYNFAVYTYKKSNPSVRSNFVYFTLTIVSNLANAVIWQTPNNVGTVRTGEISELAIESTNLVNLKVTYSLVSGSRLPQGLKLLGNGLIVGRASFEYTSFDQGTTTFDQDVRELGARLNPISFDQVYTFTVKAESVNQEIIAYRTFTINIDPIYYDPYETLYLRAQPGTVGKQIFLQIVNNTDIIPTADVYRNGDPNFGRAHDARMLLLGGLIASTPAEYIQALSKNHFRKDISIGEPKISRAYDQNRNVIYEVLYYELNDFQENNNGSVSKSIDLTNKIIRNTQISNNEISVDNTLENIDGYGSRVVYPNSFKNMRDQLKLDIGLENNREILPKWMSNRQADGSIIGWKPILVLAYLKPGSGDRVLFNLKRLSNLDQKLISFEVDRYIWDMNLSKNYDASTDSWLTSNETTFDAELDFVLPNPSATVDFAVDVPFNLLYARTTSFIDDLGGLDQIVDVYEGKTIVFATQEQFSGYTFDQDGWFKNLTLWNDNYNWDNNNEIGWDDYELIPGYKEKQANPNIVNQRSGVWKFVRNDDGLLVLEFQQEINPGETVFVRNGQKYGGYLIQYGLLIQFDEGKTVPYYSREDELKDGIPTTFDQTKTKFINNISVYEDPDQSDKYLVFPRKNIWV